MKVAALDLGTNSFLCLIAEVDNGLVTKVYQDLVKVVRLGQEVHQNKKFHPEALARARACLGEFSEQIKKEKPAKTLAMATSAARDVSNAEELFKIGRDFDIPIEVIPGGREAEITFQGGTSHLPKDHKNRVVIDVGGGSTEFILGMNHQVLQAKSLDIGCVRLTESLLTSQPVRPAEFEALSKKISETIRPITTEMKKHKIDQVIAVAGTPSALAAIELGGFEAEKVDGFRLSRIQLETWTRKLCSMSIDERIEKYKLERGRADVIAVGAMILWKSLEALEQEIMTVSIKGVRYGVALQIAERNS